MTHVPCCLAAGGEETGAGAGAREEPAGVAGQGPEGQDPGAHDRPQAKRESQTHSLYPVCGISSFPVVKNCHLTL